ncbi:MAG: hypothetical protein AAF639_41055 [Chloroflexota bacterium]
MANQRKLMIKLLNRMFGDENEELLETIIERVEANSDLATLEERYDQILDANSLPFGGCYKAATKTTTPG